MSRDLRIISNERPDLGSLHDWLADWGRWEAVDQGKVTWIHRLSRRGVTPEFSLERPLRVEAEDLPDDMSAAVVLPRWLIEINVPAGAHEDSWETAQRLSRRLADESAGVVFDPQRGEIVWPPAKRRRVPPLDGAPTSIVEMEWAIPVAGFTERLPTELLDLLRRLLPEGVPRRYGSHEPLQHRLEEGDGPFTTEWLAEQERGGALYWTGAAPVVQGSVSFPWLRVPDTGLAAGVVKLRADGRVFEHPRWCELAAVLLDEMGGLARAFSARAMFEAVPPGGVPAAEAGALPPAMVWRGAWLGLPDHPAWLTWLSPSYAAVVVPALPEEMVDDTPHGSVVALSPGPRPVTELLPWEERFPAEYCRSPETSNTSREWSVERIATPCRPASRLPA